MLTCSTCFTDYLAKCNDTIIVKAQLLPLTNYLWVIEDKFGHQYEGDFTTDADGFWQILVADLPSGFLTQYSGEFYLRVKKDAGDCNWQTFKIAGDYDCINFDIRGGTRVKDTIGCTFSNDTSLEGELSELIPFTNASDVSIAWDAGRLANFGSNPTISVHHKVTGTIYELVSVPVEKVTVDDVLTEIIIHNGVAIDGYVILQ